MQASYELSTAKLTAKPLCVSADNKLKKKLIFINRSLYLGLEDALSKTYSITESDSYDIGIKSAITCIPNLIVINCDDVNDIDMAAIKALRINVLIKHIPILILANSISDDRYIRCLGLGVDAVLHKNKLVIRVIEAQIQALVNRQEYLNEAIRNAPLMVSDDLDSIFLKRSRETIYDNLTNNKFSITEFVRLMAVSRTYLYVRIKNLTGLSTSEFVREIRLKEAAKLLKGGMYNVSEVAFKVGFNDPKYLSKRFKEKFGVSPSTFQKGKVI